MIESGYLKDNFEFLQKLKKLPHLDSFTEKDLERLMNLSKIRKYRPNEIIIAENAFDSWIYFLISGKVKVVKNDEVLSILRRTGDVFGEMGIIDGSPRSASIYAIDETVCLATDASYVDRVSGDDKLVLSYILYRIFSEILANRLRITTKELIQLKKENKILKGNDSN